MEPEPPRFRSRQSLLHQEVHLQPLARTRSATSCLWRATKRAVLESKVSPDLVCPEGQLLDKALQEREGDDGFVRSAKVHVIDELIREVPVTSFRQRLLHST